LAAPETRNALEVALASPEAVAVRVNPLPDLLSVTPANVATPLEAPSGLLVTVRTVPVAGSVPMASVIEALLVVSVVPSSRRTVTTGCVVHATVRTHPAGWGENTSTAPPETVNALEVAPVRPEAAAVRVNRLSDFLSLTPANVATPLE